MPGQRAAARPALAARVRRPRPRPGRPGCARGSSQALGARALVGRGRRASRCRGVGPGPAGRGCACALLTTREDAVGFEGGVAGWRVWWVPADRAADALYVGTASWRRPAPGAPAPRGEGLRTRGGGPGRVSGLLRAASRAGGWSVRRPPGPGRPSPRTFSSSRRRAAEAAFCAGQIEAARARLAAERLRRFSAPCVCSHGRAFLVRAVTRRHSPASRAAQHPLALRARPLPAMAPVLPLLVSVA